LRFLSRKAKELGVCTGRWLLGCVTALLLGYEKLHLILKWFQELSPLVQVGKLRLERMRPSKLVGGGRLQIRVSRNL
jgi:hypothetical protein